MVPCKGAVLNLHHRISAAININAAFINISADGFNDVPQPHNKLPWEYCLALKRSFSTTATGHEIILSKPVL